jgi:hypothetical protein
MKDAALSIVAHLPAKLISKGGNFLMRTEKISREIILVLLCSTLLEFKDKLLTT